MAVFWSHKGKDLIKFLHVDSSDGGVVVAYCACHIIMQWMLFGDGTAQQQQ